MKYSKKYELIGHKHRSRKCYHSCDNRKNTCITYVFFCDSISIFFSRKKERNSRNNHKSERRNFSEYVPKRFWEIYNISLKNVYKWIIHMKKYHEKYGKSSEYVEILVSHIGSLYTIVLVAKTLNYFYSFSPSNSFIVIWCVWYIILRKISCYDTECMFSWVFCFEIFPH